MFWQVVITVWLLKRTYGQVASRPMLLTDEQTDNCASTGLIADTKDCCHFIRCNKNVGWRLPCRKGTVFHPYWCICVHPTDYPDCDMKSCNNIPELGAQPECPSKLDATRECCLPSLGKVYIAVNRTCYTFDGERAVQCCAKGQEFLLGDCCCEGPIPEDATDCARWSFNRDDFLDDERGVFANAFAFHKMGGNRGSPADSAATGVVTGPDSAFVIPRYAGMDFRKTITVSLWIRIDSVDFNATLIHNGGFGGANASVKIEIITVQEGNTKRMYIVGGVRVSDRPEDVIHQVRSVSTFRTRGWQFIALTSCVSQAEGKDEIPVVTLYAEGQSTSADENGTPVDVDMKRIFNAATDGAKSLAEKTYAFVRGASNSERNQINAFLTETLAALENATEYIDSNLTFRFIRTEKNFRDKFLEYRDDPESRKSSTKAGVSSNIRLLRQHLLVYREHEDRLASALEEATSIVNNDALAGKLEEASRRCLEDLRDRLFKLQTVFEDNDPWDFDPNFKDGVAYRVLDRRLDEAQKLIDSIRFRRDLYRQKGDPEPVIRVSKYPFTVGNGWSTDGLVDEIVICDICADEEQIEKLRDGEIPRRFVPLDV